MYRVVIYALGAMVLWALGLSLVGVLSFSFLAAVASLGIIGASAALVHVVCSAVTRAPANAESTLITVLILFLILTPATTLHTALITALVAALSIVLKYVIAWRLRHVFNPAALALFAVGALGYTGVEWWVGSRYMVPVVFLAGLLVALKVRRVPMVLTYIGVSATVLSLYFLESRGIGSSLFFHFFSWPTLFFATIMLTEPLGMPGRSVHQYVFASVAAVVGSIPFTVGSVHGTPELALLVANLYTLIVDAPARYVLTFVKKQEVGTDTFEYSFTSTPPVRHRPGQYLEWTLPHTTPDLRGIRRYFTIASAPQSSTVSFAVRHVAGAESSWKKALRTIVPGAHLFATQRAGDFTLRKGAPHHVWIAGGIGITPFMSMIRSVVLEKQTLPATLFYCNKTQKDIAFLSELTASPANIAVVHMLAEKGNEDFPHEVGFITKEVIEKHVPEWKTATFYISGPPGLVAAYEKLLATMGVSSSRVVTDYFPGLA
jgi:ferredoxin-NADP reductase